MIDCLTALTRAQKRGSHQNVARWSRVSGPCWLIEAYAVLARRRFCKRAPCCLSANCKVGRIVRDALKRAEPLPVWDERRRDEQHPWLFVAIASYLSVSFAERRLQLRPVGW